MTPEQKQTLKAAVEADPNCSAWIAAADWPSVAQYLNSPSTWVVWATFVPTENVLNAISGAKLTPADAPNDTMLYLNRSQICLAKQASLQILLQGRDVVYGSKANIQKWLKDALQNTPSGVNGALQDAGWTDVKAALTRLATTGEKIFSTGTGTSALPADLGYDGEFDPDEVRKAMLGL